MYLDVILLCEEDESLVDGIDGWGVGRRVGVAEQ